MRTKRKSQNVLHDSKKNDSENKSVPVANRVNNGSKLQDLSWKHERRVMFSPTIQTGGYQGSKLDQGWTCAKGNHTKPNIKWDSKLDQPLTCPKQNCTKQNFKLGSKLDHGLTNPKQNSVEMYVIGR